MKKRLAIIGSTGSIGTQALEVVAENPEQFDVEVLTAYSQADLLIRQALHYMPNAVVIGKKEHYAYVDEALAPHGVKVYAGEQALEEVVEMNTVDIVLTAVVGAAGLKPTVRAIRAGKTIALANKETLVVAGELIARLTQEHKVAILPVDSEHSAIFQCLAGEGNNPVEKIILTGSGGPFRGKKSHELQNITAQAALKHPTWVMGQKITIDSASLMNKGLEVIEAKWLFGVDFDRIEVVIHPQSIIHSAVQFTDGSVKAQLGLPDMKLPIRYALTYPDRLPTNYPRLDFFQSGSFTFERPDKETFRNLELAFVAGRAGGNMPCILNAANEIAVYAFLQGQIGFLQMSDLIESCMQSLPFIAQPSLDDLLQTDQESRRSAQAWLHTHALNPNTFSI